MESVGFIAPTTEPSLHTITLSYPRTTAELSLLCRYSHTHRSSLPSAFTLGWISLLWVPMQ